MENLKNYNFKTPQIEKANTIHDIHNSYLKGTPEVSMSNHNLHEPACGFLDINLS